MSTATPESSTASPYVAMTADTAGREFLLALARRYKGVDPAIDARIDAAAEHIYGLPGAKAIPAERAGANRVPLYFEGEPGVGKTSIIAGGIQEFCRLVGLNYVENPPEDYIPQPNDFYYATVNLSGKTNPSDFGIMPYRSEAPGSAAAAALSKSASAGEAIGRDLVGRTKALVLHEGMEAPQVSNYSDGPWQVTEVSLKGEPQKAGRILQAAIRTLVDESKRNGIALMREEDADETLDANRVTYAINSGTGAARALIRAPQGAAAKAEHVSATLPNLRFHLAKKFRFSCFNFDDVANASEPVRNILLEVSQKGRYSGTMDIGNSIVAFTGNMGAEDGTNTLSRQSDAELTRVRKIRVYDTPSNWADRITKKYNKSPVGDCHMALFIKRFGDQEGIFREPAGSRRQSRGIPKTNSRALENALSVIDVHFMVAHEAGISPLNLIDRIEEDVAATAGRRVALSFREHLNAMLTEAVPLAQMVVQSGTLDQQRFEAAGGDGAWILATSKDFGYRFAYAMADCATSEVTNTLNEIRAGTAKEGDQYKTLKRVFKNMATGLNQLPSDMMNASISRLAVRLSAHDELGNEYQNSRVFNDQAITAISEALRDSITAGAWHEPEQSAKEISAVLLGINGGLLGETRKASRKANP